MIIILFTAGNFGSTMEFCLREFSQELKKVHTQVQANGSMHGFSKEMHLWKIESIQSHRDNRIEILTPTWPGLNYLSAQETVAYWQREITAQDKTIFITGSCMQDWERTIMFAHHKLQNLQLDVIIKHKARSWNPVYDSWQDMRRFELREALSFYVDQHLDFIGIDQSVPESWCRVYPSEILYNFESTVRRILDFCHLTYNDKSIQAFYENWFSKQQYILKELETIDQITSNLDNQTSWSWQPLSIMGEAIIQSRLRRQRIELLCHELDIFPHNLDMLRDKCKIVTHS